MTGSLGGSITIAGKTVSRLGFGTMRLTGPGTWGHPTDPVAAIGLLRAAVGEHRITHIDTADAYGPHTVEDLIRQALHPYPAEVLIATKVGMVRPAPNVWKPLGRPEFLRATAEQCLRRLGVECLDLCYLHRNDPTVPFLDQVGALAELQTEGKVAHIGLSKVTPEEIDTAFTLVRVAAVQNKLNQAHPGDLPTVEHCRALGIPYVPYAPLGAGALTRKGRAVKALQWLFGLGEHVAPIPGTSSSRHLAEIVEAVKSDDGGGIR
ncbi:aldo/keto reductase [Streptomyces sp. NPDC002476]|uniref:aldo/keto reductase n=1 Tax=Streptomyces sp. NPDC002476 TaxID=3364648 RepID=UPI003674B924